MKIIEQQSRGKLKTSAYNEDRVVIGPNVVGIVDGSRGPMYLERDMIENILSDSVALLSTLSDESDTETTISSLTEICAHHKKAMGLDAPMTHTGGFVFCIYIKSKRQIWQVGDCAYSVDGKIVSNDIAAETIGSRQRALIIRSRLLQGEAPMEIMKDPKYDQLIDEHLDAQLHFANRDEDAGFGFGVINGQPVPSSFIRVASLSKDARELVIVSDGYPEPTATLLKAEQKLAKMLETDPLCVGMNIGPKGLGPDRISYDDRSYVRLSL